VGAGGQLHVPHPAACVRPGNARRHSPDRPDAEQLSQAPAEALGALDRRFTEGPYLLVAASLPTARIKGKLVSRAALPRRAGH
jgi:hypothetical protein